MPILPIDLQTIFGQMGTVGKEQASQRDVAPLQQAVQGTALAQQTIRQDNEVNETLDSREGEKVADDEQQGRRRGQGSKKREGDAPEGEPRAAGDVFRDPALGKHVDVVG